MTDLTGGCHCGAIRYKASGDFSTAMECNCSHCSKKGFLLAFVPRGQFELTNGEGEFTTYHFNKGAIDHNFCKTCGVQAFGYGVGPDGNQMAAVNLRCADGIDLSALEVTPVDGKSY